MPGLNREVKSSVKIIDKISKFRKVGFNLKQNIQTLKKKLNRIKGIEEEVIADAPEGEGVIVSEDFYLQNINKLLKNIKDILSESDILPSDVISQSKDEAITALFTALVHYFRDQKYVTDLSTFIADYPVTADPIETQLAQILADYFIEQLKSTSFVSSIEDMINKLDNNKPNNNKLVLIHVKALISYLEKMLNKT